MALAGLITESGYRVYISEFGSLPVKEVCVKKGGCQEDGRSKEVFEEFLFITLFNMEKI